MVYMRASDKRAIVSATLISLVASAAILLAGTLATPVKGAQPGTSTTIPSAYAPTPTPEFADPSSPAAGSPKVLLIQDANPWGSSANQDTLTSSGIPFDLINSASFPGQDLSTYTVMMFASDQTQGYYDTLAANLAKVESFVQNGGGLIAHAADQGWNGGTWVNILPGGVTHVVDFDSNNYIIDATHPYCAGLTDADFWGSWCSHDYFTNLYAGTNTIMVEGSSNPTVIEYTFGAGTVLATTQTIEIAAAWGWAYGQAVLNNEMAYIPVMGSGFSPIDGEDIYIQRVVEIPPPTGHLAEPQAERSELFDTLSWVTVLVAGGGVAVVLIARRMRRD
jgi:hypothetical protein